MAVLDESGRREIFREIMDLLSQERQPIALLKPELRAAIDATDDWINANAASFNAALPLPARGALTAPQKARLLALVVLKRFSKGV